MNGIINSDAAKLLDKQINNLIGELSVHSLTICEAFGIPKHLLTAPIYTGYQEYYKRDITQGEHNYKPKF